MCFFFFLVCTSISFFCADDVSARPPVLLLLDAVVVVAGCYCCCSCCRAYTFSPLWSQHPTLEFFTKYAQRTWQKLNYPIFSHFSQSERVRAHSYRHTRIHIHIHIVNLSRCVEDHQGTLPYYAIYIEEKTTTAHRPIAVKGGNPMPLCGRGGHKLQRHKRVRVAMTGYYHYYLWTGIVALECEYVI